MCGLFRYAVGVVAIITSVTALAGSIPDYYSEPGYKAERSYETQQAIENYDPFSGGMQLQNIDLVAPGNGGLDIVVSRNYRSPAGPVGVLGFAYLTGRTPLGVGWDINFGRIWYEGVNGQNFFSGVSCSNNDIVANDNPVLELADGSRKILFNNSTNSGYITKDRWVGACINDGIGGLVVSSPDGKKYTLNFYKKYAGGDAWHVTKIEDQSNNSLNITYYPATSTSHALIDRVTSSDGRIVTFNYDDTTSSSVLLKSVTYGSQTVRYSHKPVPDNGLKRFYLDRATRDDGTFTTYAYHEGINDIGVHGLKKMTTPFGMSTSYVYDVVYFLGSGAINSTVLKSKSISGAGVKSGTWDYFYTPGVIDVTQVRSPDYCTEYAHKGAQSVQNGFVWQIGLLLEKRMYNSANCSGAFLQSESYNWTNTPVSFQNELHRRSGQFSLVVIFDDLAYQPLLQKKTITRDGSSYITDFSNFDIYGNPQLKIETGPSSSRSTTYVYKNIVNSSTYITGLIDTETISGLGVIDNDYYITGAKAGKLEKISRFGVVTKYDYDLAGNLSKVTDPRLKVATFKNYFRGVPERETHPEGVSIIRNVNASGTVAYEINGRGNRTSFTYDGLNRVKRITTPRSDDSNVTVSWSSGGRIKTVTRGTFSSVNTLDGLGNQVKLLSEGISKDLKYNSEGQLLFESYPSSTSGTTYQRDVLGRATKITHADGTSIKNTYLANNRVRITDENGKSTTYTYRSYGDPDERYIIKIDSPELVSTTISRDAIGNVTSISQGGKTRTFNLDSRKYLDNTVNPETGITDITVDNSGNTTSKRVGTSATTVFNYDDLNRLDNINYPIGTADVDYIYDKNSNLTGINSTSANVSYTYDDNDKLKDETIKVNGLTYKIKYSYDKRDNLSSITYPDGTVVNYSPDDLGRPTKISGFASSVSYHPNFQLKSIRYVNGKLTTVTQDNRLRTKRIDAGLISDISYTYDGTGNVKTYTDSLDSLNNRAMTYDGINRLTGLTGAWSGGSISYSLDGNIKTKNVDGINLNYTYNSTSNLLSGISGSKAYSFNYDKYGNVTGNGTDIFVYNDASQLTNISSQNTDYDYDGNNRRIVKRENGAVSKIMLYNRAGQLMYESDKYNDAQTAYIYLGTSLIARQESCSNQDNDLDGLGSCVELKIGLDPSKIDTDGDGINDGNEDSDLDGMNNVYEANNGLDLQLNDAAFDKDADGVTNLIEFTLGSKANSTDTDSDGMPDGWEFTFGLNLLVDDSQVDTDTDQLSNIIEFSIGTNPTLADTDANGVSDANEDADSDGLSNIRELQNNTDILNPDSDNDLIPDGYEVDNGLDPNNALDATLDADMDGLTNIEEMGYGTDPQNADTDFDGVNDGDEIAAGTDPLLNIPAILVPIINLILF